LGDRLAERINLSSLRTCEAISAVIPGMNAIAFTREVLAVFGEPRRMAARTALNTILRDAAQERGSSG
jgi:hypothetical protein